MSDYMLSPSAPPLKRAFTLGGPSVAERSKLFQGAPAVAPPMRRTSSVPCSATSWSDAAGPSRIMAPVYNVTRDGFLDPSLSEENILGLLPPRTKLSRARSSTNSIMKSIAEETSPLRMSSSFETVRNGTTPTTHPCDRVSPALSHNSSDWHAFISANYRRRSHTSPSMLSAPRMPTQAKADSPTLNDEATWLEEEMAGFSSDDEVVSDVQSDVGAQRARTITNDDDDKFVTPQASPTLPPLDQLPDAATGLDDAIVLPGSSTDSLLEQVKMHEACVTALQKLTQSGDAAYNRRPPGTATSDSALLLPLPPKPRRSSLLAAPQRELLRRTSNGDFASTRATDGSELFDSAEDACYDPSRSPGAESGHCDVATHRPLSVGARRISTASRLSSSSSASGSVASHGSSLLYDGLQITVPMTMSPERAESIDTGYSTRPSSATSSSFYSNGRRSSTASASSYSALSPVRKNMMPPLTLASKGEAEYGSGHFSRLANDVGLADGDRSNVARKNSKASERVLRQAKNRRLRNEGLGCEPLRPPMRLDSLESTVAAAPSHQQSRAEFPERLLGDWMMSPTNSSPSFDSTHHTGNVYARPKLTSTTSMTSLPTSDSHGSLNHSILDRFRRSTVSNSDRKRITANASQAEAEWQTRADSAAARSAGFTSLRSIASSASLRPRGSTVASFDGAKEIKLRPGLSFLRKLQSSSEDGQHAYDASSLNKLSAATFGREGSPASSRSGGSHPKMQRGDSYDRDQSFLALEHDEYARVERPRMTGRKDLRKVFGACDEELEVARALAQTQTSGERNPAAPSSWSSSLGRSASSSFW